MLSGALLGIPTRLDSCSWDGYEPSMAYNFMSPENYRFENLQAFHFTYDRLYNYDLLEESVSEDANLQDWVAHLGPKASIDELRKLVYGSSEEQFRALAGAIKGMHESPYPISRFKLNEEFKAGKYLEEIEYLAMAKQFEPYSSYYDEWEEKDAAPIPGFRDLVNEALAAQAKTANRFLKLRYGYQVVRIYHRNRYFKEAKEAWEQHVKPLADVKSVIWWWSMCDYAGALRNLGLEAEAAYHFSLVFDHCPSRRGQAWYGWRIQDEAIWQNSLAMCKDNHEKSLQYFLRCADPNALPIDDVKAMHDLEPNSRYLELILLREINKIEQHMFGYAFESETPFHLGFSPDYPSDTDYSPAEVKELRDFVASALRNANHHDRDFWSLADAYLSFLSGDFAEAKTKLAVASPGLSAPYVPKAAILDVVFKICATETIDSATENVLLDQVTHARTLLGEDDQSRLTNLLDDGLSLVYRKQGQIAKALLARRSAETLWDKSSLAEIDEMLAFIRRPKNSRYEELLGSRIEGGENSLLELRGTRLLGEDRFDEAIKVFEALPESYRAENSSFFLEDDPFIGKTHDIINCEGRYCAAGKYTKLSFAQRVQELRKLTISDHANMARHQLELGHAFYNSSYYGPAWGAMDYYRRYTWFEFAFREPEEEGEKAPDMDEVRDRRLMDLAVQYYTWAMQNATNKEMAAEACFHLAKAQQNIGYMDGQDWEEQQRPAFDQLMAQHRGTKFYTRMVRECKYFYFYSRK